MAIFMMIELPMKRLKWFCDYVQCTNSAVIKFVTPTAYISNWFIHHDTRYISSVRKAVSEYIDFRKQLFANVLQNSCSQKFRNIHRKTLVLESLFDKETFVIKKKLQHRCFPVNITKFLRTPFSQNISGRLLVDFLIEELRLRNLWWINWGKNQRIYLHPVL